MNLSQLECPIEFGLAEELSFFLEEEALAVSWYEKAPEDWFLQVIFDPSQKFLLETKIEKFFKEGGLSLPALKTSPLLPEDWVSSVYRDFPPLTIGRFYIYGSHIREVPPTGFVPLQIDAATAFGSGQHESTEGCLKALSLLAEQNSFISPLDMGCGSGILALAMASLWKVKVLACDNDPEAVRVTGENAQINALGSYIETQVSEGFSALQDKSFDLIAANILAGPLCQMARDVKQFLKPGGYIVLAGLLNRQAEDVIDAYRNIGTKLANQLLIGDWSTLIMRKDIHG